METTVREKYDLIKIGCLLENRLNVSNSAREKKKSHPWKFSKIIDFIPVKKKSTREKIVKSVRENFWLPVKSWKKVCVKTIFYPWKNSKKGPKMAFTGTFDFHGKKNAELNHSYMVS